MSVIFDINNYFQEVDFTQNIDDYYSLKNSASHDENTEIRSIVSSDEFVKQFRSLDLTSDKECFNRFLVFKNLIITGKTIALNDITTDIPFVFINCVLLGHLVLNRSSYPLLVLRNCDVRRIVSRDSNIRGAINIYESTIFMGVDFSHSEIKGSIYIHRTAIGDYLRSNKNILVAKNELGEYCESNPNCEIEDISFCRTSLKFARCTIKGTLTIASSDIHRSIDLFGTTLCQLRIIEETTIKRCYKNHHNCAVWAHSMTILGDCWIKDVHISGELDFTNTYCQQNLIVENIPNSRHDLHKILLEGMTIKGNIQINGISQMSKQKEATELLYDYEPTSIDMRNMEIGGNVSLGYENDGDGINVYDGIDMYGTSVQGNVNISQLVIKTPGVLLMDRVKISKSLRIGDLVIEEIGEVNNTASKKVYCGGGISLKDAKISGDLKILGTKVRPIYRKEGKDKSIYMRGIKVDGNLYIGHRSDYQAERNDTHVECIGAIELQGAIIHRGINIDKLDLMPVVRLEHNGPLLNLESIVVGRSLKLEKHLQIGGSISLYQANIQMELMIGEINWNEAAFKKENVNGALLNFEKISCQNLILNFLSPDDNGFFNKFSKYGIRLDGAKFDSLGKSRNERELINELPDVTEIKDFLSYMKRYTPQPYNEIAHKYLVAGDKEAYNQLMYEKNCRRISKLRELNSVDTHSFKRQISLKRQLYIEWFLDKIFGWGYKRTNTVYGLIILVILGSLIGGFTTFNKIQDYDKKSDTSTTEITRDEIKHNLIVVIPKEIITALVRSTAIALPGLESKTVFIIMYNPQIIFWERLYWIWHKIMGTVLIGFLIAGVSGLADKANRSVDE